MWKILSQKSECKIVGVEGENCFKLKSEILDEKKKSKMQQIIGDEEWAIGYKKVAANQLPFTSNCRQYTIIVPHKKAFRIIPWVKSQLTNQSESKYVTWLEFPMLFSFELVNE